MNIAMKKTLQLDLVRRPLEDPKSSFWMLSSYVRKVHTPFELSILYNKKVHYEEDLKIELWKMTLTTTKMSFLSSWIKKLAIKKT